MTVILESGGVGNPVYSFSLVVPGPAIGKGRPRFNTHTGRTYTDAKTRAAETDVRAIWREAGEPRIPDGCPVELLITVHLERPVTHWRKDGMLSAAGCRSIYPTRRPDLDNVAKNIADSLNGLGFKDDAQVTDWMIKRRWCPRHESARTDIQVRALAGIGAVLA